MFYMRVRGRVLHSQVNYNFQYIQPFIVFSPISDITGGIPLETAGMFIIKVTGNNIVPQKVNGQIVCCSLIPTLLFIEITGQHRINPISAWESNFEYIIRQLCSIGDESLGSHCGGVLSGNLPEISLGLISMRLSSVSSACGQRIVRGDDSFVLHRTLFLNYNSHYQKSPENHGNVRLIAQKATSRSI